MDTFFINRAIEFGAVNVTGFSIIDHSNKKYKNFVNYVKQFPESLSSIQDQNKTSVS